MWWPGFATLDASPGELTPAVLVAAEPAASTVLVMNNRSTIHALPQPHGPHSRLRPGVTYSFVTVTVYSAFAMAMLALLSSGTRQVVFAAAAILNVCVLAGALLLRGARITA